MYLQLMGWLVNSIDYYNYMFDSETYLSSLGKTFIWYLTTLFSIIVSIITLFL